MSRLVLIEGLSEAETRLAKAMPERELQKLVNDYAKLRGWMRVHITPAWVHDRNRPRMITPYQGDKGLPDNILARDGRVILAELKTEKGEWRDGQQEWLAASGGYCWRPSDWFTGRVRAVLD